LGFSIFFGITAITLILWQLKLSYRLLFLEKMPWINLLPNLIVFTNQALDKH